MYDSLLKFGTIIGGLLTLFTFLMTFLEFRKNNKIKRAEFLEKLTSEFNESNLLLAKKILDDFWVETEGSPELTDADLIRQGSREAIPKEELKNQLAHLLRYHGDIAVTGFGEQQVRQSFDDLLDFFTKLQYYLDLRLITRDEIAYFGYYLRKCYRKKEVLNYASTYKYSLAIKLITTFGQEEREVKVA